MPRRLLVLVALASAGCGTAPTVAPPLAAHPRPPPPPPCATAALGLAQAVSGALAPADDQPPSAIVRLCESDGWPAAATQCFADMRGGDALAPCAAALPPAARARLFVELTERGGGAAADRAALAVAGERLRAIHLGVAACDRFVAVVALALGCDQLPVPSRVALGEATADTWSISADRLSPPSRARMEAACVDAQAELSRQLGPIGCSP